MSKAGFLVTLDKDIHPDDLEHHLNAIRMLRGVISVQPLEGDHAVAIGYERAREELQNQMRDILKRRY